jgi:uncharacterized protein (DUF305 family)
MTTFRRIAVPLLATMAVLTACSQETPEAAPASPSATAETSTPVASPSPSPVPSLSPEASPEAEPSAVPTPEKGFNDADVTFAASMIPHHLQALDLTQLASTRAHDLWVRDLAGRVRSQREPEIRIFKAWLDTWGEQPLPRDHKLPGGVTQAKMTGLAAASGTAFDRMFITLMIDHHEGALALARSEEEQGAHGDAKAMAGEIVVTQEAELKEMKKFLAQLKK